MTDDTTFGNSKDTAFTPPEAPKPSMDLSKLCKLNSKTTRKTKTQEINSTNAAKELNVPVEQNYSTSETPCSFDKTPGNTPMVPKKPMKKNAVALKKQIDSTPINHLPASLQRSASSHEKCSLVPTEVDNSGIKTGPVDSTHFGNVALKGNTRKQRKIPKSRKSRKHILNSLISTNSCIIHPDIQLSKPDNGEPFEMPVNPLDQEQSAGNEVVLDNTTTCTTALGIHEKMFVTSEEPKGKSIEDVLKLKRKPGRQSKKRTLIKVINDTTAGASKDTVHTSPIASPTPPMDLNKPGQRSQKAARRTRTQEMSSTTALKERNVPAEQRLKLETSLLSETPTLSDKKPRNTLIVQNKPRKKTTVASNTEMGLTMSGHLPASLENNGAVSQISSLVPNEVAESDMKTGTVDPIEAGNVALKSNGRKRRNPSKPRKPSKHILKNSQLLTDSCNVHTGMDPIETGKKEPFEMPVTPLDQGQSAGNEMVLDDTTACATALGIHKIIEDVLTSMRKSRRPSKKKTLIKMINDATPGNSNDTAHTSPTPSTPPPMNLNKPDQRIQKTRGRTKMQKMGSSTALKELDGPVDPMHADNVVLKSNPRKPRTPRKQILKNNLISTDSCNIHLDMPPSEPGKEEPFEMSVNPPDKGQSAGNKVVLDDTTTCTTALGIHKKMSVISEEPGGKSIGDLLKLKRKPLKRKPSRPSKKKTLIEMINDATPGNSNNTAHTSLVASPTPPMNLEKPCQRIRKTAQRTKMQEMETTTALKELNVPIDHCLEQESSPLSETPLASHETPRNTLMVKKEPGKKSTVSLTKEMGLTPSGSSPASLQSNSAGSQEKCSSVPVEVDKSGIKDGPVNLTHAGNVAKKGNVRKQRKSTKSRKPRKPVLNNDLYSTDSCTIYPGMQPSEPGKEEAFDVSVTPLDQGQSAGNEVVLDDATTCSTVLGTHMDTSLISEEPEGKSIGDLLKLKRQPLKRKQGRRSKKKTLIKMINDTIPGTSKDTAHTSPIASTTHSMDLNKPCQRIQKTTRRTKTQEMNSTSTLASKTEMGMTMSDHLPASLQNNGAASQISSSVPIEVAKSDMKTGTVDPTEAGNVALKCNPRKQRKPPKSRKTRKHISKNNLISTDSCSIHPDMEPTEPGKKEPSEMHVTPLDQGQRAGKEVLLDNTTACAAALGIHKSLGDVLTSKRKPGRPSKKKTLIKMINDATPGNSNDTAHISLVASPTPPIDLNKPCQRIQKTTQRTKMKEMETTTALTELNVPVDQCLAQESSPLSETPCSFHETPGNTPMGKKEPRKKSIVALKKEMGLTPSGYLPASLQSNGAASQEKCSLVPVEVDKAGRKTGPVGTGEMVLDNTTASATALGINKSIADVLTVKRKPGRPPKKKTQIKMIIDATPGNSNDKAHTSPIASQATSVDLNKTDQRIQNITRITKKQEVDSTPALIEVNVPVKQLLTLEQSAENEVILADATTCATSLEIHKEMVVKSEEPKGKSIGDLPKVIHKPGRPFKKKTLIKFAKLMAILHEGEVENDVTILQQGAPTFQPAKSDVKNAKKDAKTAESNSVSPRRSDRTRRSPQKLGYEIMPEGPNQSSAEHVLPQPTVSISNSEDSACSSSPACLMGDGTAEVALQNEAHSSAEGAGRSRAEESNSEANVDEKMLQIGSPQQSNFQTSETKSETSRKRKLPDNSQRLVMNAKSVVILPADAFLGELPVPSLLPGCDSAKYGKESLSSGKSYNLASKHEPHRRSARRKLSEADPSSSPDIKLNVSEGKAGIKKGVVDKMDNVNLSSTQPQTEVNSVAADNNLILPAQNPDRTVKPTIKESGPPSSCVLQPVGKEAMAVSDCISHTERKPQQKQRLSEKSSRQKGKKSVIGNDASKNKQDLQVMLADACHEIEKGLKKKIPKKMKDKKVMRNRDYLNVSSTHTQSEVIGAIDEVLSASNHNPLKTNFASDSGEIQMAEPDCPNSVEREPLQKCKRPKKSAKPPPPKCKPDLENKVSEKVKTPGPKGTLVDDHDVLEDAMNEPCKNLHTTEPIKAEGVRKKRRRNTGWATKKTSGKRLSKANCLNTADVVTQPAVDNPELSFSSSVWDYMPDETVRPIRLGLKDWFEQVTDQPSENTTCHNKDVPCDRKKTPRKVRQPILNKVYSSLSVTRSSNRVHGERQRQVDETVTPSRLELNDQVDAKSTESNSVSLRRSNRTSKCPQMLTDQILQGPNQSSTEHVSPRPTVSISNSEDLACSSSTASLMGIGIAEVALQNEAHSSADGAGKKRSRVMRESTQQKTIVTSEASYAKIAPDSETLLEMVSKGKCLQNTTKLGRKNTGIRAKNKEKFGATASEQLSSDAVSQQNIHVHTDHSEDPCSIPTQTVTNLNLVLQQPCEFRTQTKKSMANLGASPEAPLLPSCVKTESNRSITEESRSEAYVDEKMLQIGSPQQSNFQPSDTKPTTSRKRKLPDNSRRLVKNSKSVVILPTDASLGELPVTSLLPGCDSAKYGKESLLSGKSYNLASKCEPLRRSARRKLIEADSSSSPDIKLNAMEGKAGIEKGVIEQTDYVNPSSTQPQTEVNSVAADNNLILPAQNPDSTEKPIIKESSPPSTCVLQSVGKEAIAVSASLTSIVTAEVALQNETHSLPEGADKKPFTSEASDAKMAPDPKTHLEMVSKGKGLQKTTKPGRKNTGIGAKNKGKFGGSASQLDLLHLTIKPRKPIQCVFCRRSFRHISAYTVHKRLHTGEKPYRCIKCGKTFAQVSKLHLHTDLHKQPEAIQCPCCSLKFRSKHEFIAHFKIHMKTQKKSSLINDKRRDGKKIKAQLYAASHNPPLPLNSSTSFRCQSCFEEFTNIDTLEMHASQPNCRSFTPHSYNDDDGMKSNKSSSFYIHEGSDQPVKLYACAVCDKRFHHLSKLGIHSRMHSDDVPFVCVRCNQNFTSFTSLHRHQVSNACTEKTEKIKGKVETNLQQSKVNIEGFLVEQGVNGQINTPMYFKCQLCKQLHRHWCQYTLHLQTHTKTQPYLCDTCGQQYNEVPETRVHCQVCCEKSGEKRACNVSLSEVWQEPPSLQTPTPDPDLLNEDMEMPSPSSSSVLGCRAEHQEKQLECHRPLIPSSQCGRYSCARCGKSFDQWNKLWLHRKQHSQNGSRYPCTQCNLEFRFFGSYRDHMREHAAQSPFACPMCPDAFINEQDLNTHFGEYHKPRESLKCEICGKDFKRFSNLARHSVLHSGASSYYCLPCHMSFSTTGALKDHLKTHKPRPDVPVPRGPMKPFIFPYNCRKCKDRFTSTDLLEAHQVCHLGEDDKKGLGDEAHTVSRPLGSQHPDRVRQTVIPEPSQYKRTLPVTKRKNPYWYPHPDRLYVVPIMSSEPPVILSDTEEDIEVVLTIPSTRNTLIEPQVDLTIPSTRNTPINNATDSVHNDHTYSMFSHMERSAPQLCTRISSEDDADDEGDDDLMESSRRVTTARNKRQRSNGFKCSDCSAFFTEESKLHEHYVQHAMGVQ